MNTALDYSTYSFSEVTFVLNHPTLGQCVLTGQGVGSIVVAHAQDASTQEVAHDGSVMTNKIYAKHGTLSFSLLQTSSGNAWIDKAYNTLLVADASEWAKFSGTIESRALPPEKLQSGVTVLSVTPKPAEAGIEHADVLVVAGRGLRKESGLQLLKDLAEELGGQLACTRPLVECGWVEARRQVGLSGRTVRPRLLITCGVSGAIQFVAGMNHAGTIIAINKDENAPIFKTAHVGLVGDLYEIVPALTQAIRADKEARP